VFRIFTELATALIFGTNILLNNILGALRIQMKGYFLFQQLSGAPSPCELFHNIQKFDSSMNILNKYLLKEYFVEDI